MHSLWKTVSLRISESIFDKWALFAQQWVLSSTKTNIAWFFRDPFQSRVGTSKGWNVHSAAQHWICLGKMSVTKSFKKASCSNTKSINENKFQQVNNVSCRWRSQANYNCSLCFLLLLSHICASQGQVNRLLREWSVAREPCVCKVGACELTLWYFPFQQQQDRAPEVIPVLEPHWLLCEQSSSEEKILVQDY